MDDDGGDWFADAGDDAKPEEAAPPPAEAAPADAAPEEAAAEEEGEKKAAAEAEPEFLDPNKLLVFKHWIRPKFLQYHYLYKYRHNYYDDVIDYLDKKQKGLSRDVPRAQTWAERVLRSTVDKKNRDDYFSTLDSDTRLVSRMQTSGAFYHYHTRQYINRRYSSLLN